MSLRTKILAVARAIPRGRVATYGQIALLAGSPGAARQVGYAMNDLPQDSNVPWHRVINAKGEVSSRASGDEELQRVLLEQEGITFDTRLRIDLDRYLWRPRKRFF